MSAFMGKADIEWRCEQSPLLTRSGHSERQNRYRLLPDIAPEPANVRF